MLDVLYTDLVLIECVHVCKECTSAQVLNLLLSWKYF